MIYGLFVFVVVTPLFFCKGVDLSNIVKAVPKASSEETTDDQTHEVLQVQR